MSEHSHDDRCRHPSPEVIRHGCAHDVAEYGWHCVGVLDAPPFTYTVGLFATYNHPELTVAGLPPQTAHAVLAAAVRVIASEAQLADGQERTDILDGFPARFRALVPADCSVSFAVANDFYGRDDIPRLQLLWPDQAGHFPSAAACVPDIAAAQDLGG